MPSIFPKSLTIFKMYGLENPKKEYPKEINPEEETEYFGRKCLIARRLIERGVRFVQVWSGNDNGFPRRNWDSHEDMTRDHPSLAMGMARGHGCPDQGFETKRLVGGYHHSLDHGVW